MNSRFVSGNRWTWVGQMLAAATLLGSGAGCAKAVAFREVALPAQVRAGSHEEGGLGVLVEAFDTGSGATPVKVVARVYRRTAVVEEQYRPIARDVYYDSYRPGLDLVYKYLLLGTGMVIGFLDFGGGFDGQQKAKIAKQLGTDWKPAPHSFGAWTCNWLPGQNGFLALNFAPEDISAAAIERTVHDSAATRQTKVEMRLPVPGVELGLGVGDVRTRAATNALGFVTVDVPAPSGALSVSVDCPKLSLRKRLDVAVGARAVPVGG